MQKGYKMKTHNIQWISVLALAFMLTGCPSSKDKPVEEVTVVQPTPAEKAIAKIKAYATSNGASSAPVLQDYLDVGVTGLDASELADINEVVENLTADEVDTVGELQALADALGTTTDTTAPVFTSNDTVTVNENQTSAITLVATDASVVTYSISGTDASSFNVDANSGVVTFNTAPDYESGTTTYAFTATATDTANNSASQHVTINIADINETIPPIVSSKKIVSFRNVPVVTDGTVNGTKYLLDPYNTPNHMRTKLSLNNELSTYTTANGITFFFAIDDVHGGELWKTDGTPAGTGIVKDIFTGMSDSISIITFPRLVGIKDHVYFIASSTNSPLSSSIYKSDGTDAGTVPIFFNNNRSEPMIVMDDMLYFSHGTSSKGVEPWISDGKNGGHIIKDIAFYSMPTHTIASSYPRHFISYKNRVYFFAQYYDTNDNSISTYALHTTDGTDNGTSIVSDMAIGSKMVECGGLLYFAGLKRIGEKYKLWKSNGSAAGTTPIDVATDKIDSIPQLTCVNDSVYFLGKDSNNTSGLWKSDGTSSGTYFVKKIAGINDMKPVGDKLIAITGTEIWVSDGTSSGTVQLEILDKGIYSITPLTNKKVLISSYDSLWVTDGTLTGSKKLLERP